MSKFFLIALSFVFVFQFQANAATNRAPTANSQNVVTNEDTPLAIVLSGTDPENATLTFSISRAPNKGTLTCLASTCLYTPNSNINGSDIFYFKVNDGSLSSRPAAVSIVIQAVNDAPTVSVAAVTFNEDYTATIRPSKSDVDGDATTLRIVSAPEHGSTTVSGDTIVYTPIANYNGTDRFDLVANDGQVNSSAATAVLTINPVNDAPVALSQSVVTDEDTVAVIPLTVSDVDGDALTVAFGYQSTNGQVTSSGSTVTYTPDANFYGTDSFTYRITDGVAASDMTEVQITVNAVNDPPVAYNTDLQVIAGTAEVVALTATDTEGSILAYALVGEPLNGQATLIGNNILYQANTNASGDDVINFVVSDSQRALSNVASVQVHIGSQGTVVPISLHDLQPISGVTVNISTGKIVTTLAQHACYDAVATPLVVPIKMQDGQLVDAVAFTLHSKCPNTTEISMYGALVLTSDGSAWQFTSEAEMNLRPDSQGTGHFDPLGILSYPLTATRNDSGDPDHQTGGFVQYIAGQTIFSDTHIGRALDTSTLNLDGIFPLWTTNPFIPTCLTGHKIDAENCGVPAFLNKLTQQILDRSFYSDNGLEAWLTAAGVRVKVNNQQGNEEEDYWAVGTGSGGNIGDAPDVGGGCKGIIVKTNDLQAAVLGGSFKQFDIFAHTYDPGDPGCTNLSSINNTLLSGSAMQGEATPSVDPGTGDLRFWYKGFQPDITGDSHTRISQVDAYGDLICDVLIDSGASRNPFHGVTTGMVIDGEANAYTNVDYFNASGVLKTGVMQISPTCSTKMLFEFTQGQVGGSMSQVTLVADAQNNKKLLGALNGNLYSYDFASDTISTMALSSSDGVVSGPVITSTGQVVILHESNILEILGSTGFSYGDNLWPRFRHDNFGSATVTIVR